jgi:transcriptional regulator with XRE-family HTH domain
MRGLSDTLSVGERIAWYRQRRGMSQEVLAGLVGRTADWLSKVENNGSTSIGCPFCNRWPRRWM